MIARIRPHLGKNLALSFNMKTHPQKRGLRLLSVLTLLTSGACSDTLTGPAVRSSDEAQAALSTSSTTLQPGYYRSSATDPAVYMVHGGRRWLVPDPETFQACTGGFWTLVQPNFRVKDIPLAGTIPSARTYPNLHKGSPFVLTGTGTVYTATGCVKSGIPNPDVYRTLYGNTDFSRVVAVSSSVFNAFPTAAKVAFSPRIAPGTLIRGSGGEVRWVLHMGASLGVPSPCAVESHTRNLWEVTQVSDAVFNAYSSVGVLQSVNAVCDGLDIGARYLSYSPYMAVQYAKTWALRPYGTGAGQNLWPSTFTNKCTFFVSQALMGGFIRRSAAQATWAERWRFKDAGWDSDWWFISLNDRGKAFSGASDLYKYAVLQARTASNMRPGIQFQFATSHTNTSKGGADYGPTGYSRIWVDGVRTGDVVFFDFDRDGDIDHVMMVVEVRASAPRASDRIRLAGQTNETIDRSLGQVLDTYQAVQVFIYHPTGYVNL